MSDLYIQARDAGLAELKSRYVAELQDYEANAGKPVEPPNLDVAAIDAAMAKAVAEKAQVEAELKKAVDAKEIQAKEFVRAACMEKLDDL